MTKTKRALVLPRPGQEAILPLPGGSRIHVVMRTPLGYLAGALISALQVHELELMPGGQRVRVTVDRDRWERVIAAMDRLLEEVDRR